MTIAIDDGAGEGPTAPLNEATVAVASIHLPEHLWRSIQMASSWTKRKCYENFLVAQNAFLLSSLPLLFTAGVYLMQLSLNTPCIREGGRQCTPEYQELATFFNGHDPFLPVLLILAHALPFLVLGLVINEGFQKSDDIKRNHSQFNPVKLALGMASIGAGLGFEIGWHVTTSFYYPSNEFHLLNWAFWFFFLLGSALWADSFRTTRLMDAVFAAILMLSSVLYAVATFSQDGFLVTRLSSPVQGVVSSAKIVLSAGVLVEFGAIVWRGRKIFGWKDVLIMTLLIVVVNLLFIFLLDGVAYEPGVELTSLNYFYHFAHDILGTEAGLLYFWYMLRKYPSSRIEISESEHEPPEEQKV